MFVVDSLLSKKIEKVIIISSSLMLILFILGYILTSILQRLISKPILQLADTAEEISKKSSINFLSEILYEDIYRTYDENINDNSKNEIEKLKIAFYRMVLSLNTRDSERKKIEQELLEERSSLEVKVKERTKDLNIANAELARSSRLKDEFIANMSHELRTPLTAILGMTEVLKEQNYGTLNEQQYDFLQTVEESGRHLLNLINDILDLSKIEAGKMKLQFDQVYISEICDISLRLIKQIANNKKLNIKTSFNNISPFIYADPIKLKQILFNLLSNAVKFTPEKGKIGIEVIEDIGSGVIQFIVWDNGIGISPEDISVLFQPFVQIDSSLSRKYSGTGLGLALVSRLAKIHGGDVKVESVLGVGSKFFVSLPLNKENADIPAKTEETEEILNVQKDLSKELILIVDDHEENLITFLYYLEAKGYKIITAKNSFEAIKITITKHPSLILMDIQMPEMNGFEAIKRIRSYPELGSIPIIALTALAMPGDREKCLEAGANAYLSKPVSLKVLAEMISKQLAP